MNNQWNKFIYKVVAPVYDRFFNSGVFLNARKKVFGDLVLRDGEHVLLVGVGTGADLCFFTEQDIHITAIDISSSMISQAKNKVTEHMNVDFYEMDAQQLQFSEQTFDVVVANLILSVVPDANQCMNEILRVTKDQGSILVFDKFTPRDKKLSFGKKILRPLITLLGTDIGRHFENIIEPYEKQVNILDDRPVLFNGMYRKISIQKLG